MIRGDQVQNPHLWIPVPGTGDSTYPDDTGWRGEKCALCGHEAAYLGHADLSGEEFGMLFKENQLVLSLGQTWAARDGERACLVGTTAMNHLVILVGPSLYVGGLQLIRESDFRERYKSLLVLRFEDRKSEG